MSKYNQPDRVLRQRYRTARDAAGGICAISEQCRHRHRGHPKCAWLVGGRRDQETMDVGTGIAEEEYRGGGLRTLLVKIVIG